MDVRDWRVGSVGKVLVALSTRTGVWNPSICTKLGRAVCVYHSSARWGCSGQGENGDGQSSQSRGTLPQKLG